MCAARETRQLVGVVDDDSSIRKALSRLLRAGGLGVEVFASAGEFLAFEWPVRPACLVIDIRLPDMSGLSLLRQIVATEPDTAVVILTGDADPQLKVQALQAGAAAFLTKPFDELLFLDRIRQAIENHPPEVLRDGPQASG